MFQEGEEISTETGYNISKHALFTILVCVGICMFFMRTVFFSLVYLVPLGYAVLATGSASFVFFAAVMANAFVYFITGLFNPSASRTWLEIFYFSILFLGFTWIIGGKNIRTAYRFIFASAAGAVVFLVTVSRPDSIFYTMFLRIADEISPGLFSPEIVELIRTVLLRGGALVSIFFVFFINRQLAIGIFGMIKKQRIDRGLIAFFAPYNTIWVFSGALVTVLMTRFVRIEVLEIIAWNVIVTCAIIFLAQGTGILLYLLSRRTPAFRLAVNVVIIIVLLSPLSAIVIAALLLLGITETFRPLRQSVQ